MGLVDSSEDEEDDEEEVYESEDEDQVPESKPCSVSEAVAAAAEDRIAILERRVHLEVRGVPLPGIVPIRDGRSYVRHLVEDVVKEKLEEERKDQVLKRGLKCFLNEEGPSEERTLHGAKNCQQPAPVSELNPYKLTIKKLSPAPPKICKGEINNCPGKPATYRINVITPKIAMCLPATHTALINLSGLRLTTAPNNGNNPNKAHPLAQPTVLLMV